MCKRERARKAPVGGATHRRSRCLSEMATARFGASSPQTVRVGETPNSTASFLTALGGWVHSQQATGFYSRGPMCRKLTPEPGVTRPGAPIPALLSQPQDGGVHPGGPRRPLTTPGPAQTVGPTSHTLESPGNLGEQIPCALASGSSE